MSQGPTQFNERFRVDPRFRVEVTMLEINHAQHSEIL